MVSQVFHVFYGFYSLNITYIRIKCGIPLSNFSFMGRWEVTVLHTYQTPSVQNCGLQLKAHWLVKATCMPGHLSMQVWNKSIEV